LTYDPKKRFNAEKAIAHSWIQSKQTVSVDPTTKHQVLDNLIHF